MALLLLTSWGGGSVTDVRAQQRGDPESRPPQRVTLVAAGVPLQEALEALIDRTRIDLVYDNALVLDRTAFCRVEREPLERALACVLRGTGLDFARLSSGTYTLLPGTQTEPRWGGLTGEVIDAETGTPLAGAHVVLALGTAGETPGTAVNADGRFALPRLLPGRRRLVVTHVGYRPVEVFVHVEPDRTERVAVELVPEPVLTAPIVVSGLERQALSERLGAGRVEAGALTDATDRETDGVPVLAPTPDVSEALGAVVGVRAGEALADVHVQGAAASEHALLLDGVPVLVPVSLGGLVGPFSPFALSRIVVHKAGYGAGDGSYLAGVVRAESALAPLAGESVAVQIDPLSLNARWGGRMGRSAQTEGAWALAVRRSLWSAGLAPTLARRLRSWAAPDPFLIEQLGQETVPPTSDGFPVDVGFTDAHAAGRLRFGGLRSLYGSLYLARHNFGVEDTGLDDTPADELYEDAYRWANETGQLRYEWVQGDRAFAHVGAWSSGYRLRRPAVLDDVDGDLNAIRATGVLVGVDLAAAPHHAVASRLEVTHYRSDLAPGITGVPDATDLDGALRWVVAGFVEDRIALGSQASLTVGARLTWLPERQALHAEPRVALRLDGTGTLGPWAARVAAGRYLQFLAAVDVADGGPAPLLPGVRLWLPLGEGDRAPEAYHLAAEALVQPAPGWEVGVETYGKHQPHLLVADYGGSSPGPLTPAEGYAAGLALRVQRHTDRLRLGVTYELSATQRRTPGRFGGWVPAPWSAPHRLQASLDATPLPRLTLTVRGEAVFGRSWGFRQAYYDLLEPAEATRSYRSFDLSQPQQHTLPAFVQLDASAAYTTTVAGVGVQARLGLLNALGRDNVRDWLLAPEGATDALAKRPRYATPFLPVFALRLTR